MNALRPTLEITLTGEAGLGGKGTEGVKDEKQVCLNHRVEGTEQH